MSRLIILIVILVVVGGLFALSTRVKEQPTHQIEVAVPAVGGNAH